MFKNLLSLGVGAFLLAGCQEKKEIIIVKPRGEAIKDYRLPDVTGRTCQQIKIKFGEDESPYKNVDFVFHRRFSEEDIALAKLSVRFVEELMGQQYDISYNNLYWSDDILTSMGAGTSLLGMTVYHEKREEWRAYVAIASELRPKSLHHANSIRDFGVVLVHEFDHVKNLTAETIVRSKINWPAAEQFHNYYHIKVEEFYPQKYANGDFEGMPYVTLLEKVLYDVGIFPPWRIDHDYMDSITSEGQRIRLQLIPVPNILTNSPAQLPTNLMRLDTNASLTNISLTLSLPLTTTNNSLTITNDAVLDLSHP